MTVLDMISFAKENPVCTIATVDGDQPHARAFLSVFFEDNDNHNIYFTTGRNKNVFKQLNKNPKVELCYLAKDFKTMMRLTGVVEVVDDRAKKQKLINERDYLRGFKADDSELILLRISHGEARMWSLENNLNEDKAPSVRF
ncbi:MAG: pyridoxamine 5'-phosphate oxidase family protein [Deltaproteobacteria bacterium]|nr:pyridoxamine 5'-phosphate oxidase family protein [Deltaproteobacteria bacterium]